MLILCVQEKNLQMLLQSTETSFTPCHWSCSCGKLIMKVLLNFSFDLMLMICRASHHPTWRSSEVKLLSSLALEVELVRFDSNLFLRGGIVQKFMNRSVGPVNSVVLVWLREETGFQVLINEMRPTSSWTCMRRFYWFVYWFGPLWLVSNLAHTIDFPTYYFRSTYLRISLAPFDFFTRSDSCLPPWTLTTIWRLKFWCGPGRALAVALASKGVQVTILDLKAEQGEESVRLVEEEHAKTSYKPDSPSALFIQCDITNTCMLQDLELRFIGQT